MTQQSNSGTAGKRTRDDVSHVEDQSDSDSDQPTGKSARPRRDTIICTCDVCRDYTYEGSNRRISKRHERDHRRQQEERDREKERAKKRALVVCMHCTERWPQGHKVSIAVRAQHKATADKINRMARQIRQHVGESSASSGHGVHESGEGDPSYDDELLNNLETNDTTSRRRRRQQQDGRTADAASAGDIPQGQNDRSSRRGDRVEEARQEGLDDDNLAIMHSYMFFCDVWDDAGAAQRFADDVNSTGNDDDENSGNETDDDGAVQPDLIERSLRVYLKLVAWASKPHITRDDVSELWLIMKEEFNVTLPSVKYASRRLRKMTGIKPKYYDCCKNSCMLFVGDLKRHDICLHCKEPDSRYRPQPAGSQRPKKPQKKMLYLPIRPRLRAQYAWKERAKILRTYRAAKEKEPCDVKKDIFHGDLYRNYIKGIKKLFSQPTDIAFQLSMDGFQLVKQRDFSSTPVILVNLSLPPEQRYKMKNVLLVCLIPGPKEPKDLNSFLYPLVKEMNKLHIGRGVEDVFDASTGRTFTLRAWLILCTADGKQMAKIIGMKTPGNAKSPCRICEIEGVRSKNRKADTNDNGQEQHDENGETVTSLRGGVYYVPHPDRDSIEKPIMRTRLRQQMMDSRFADDDTKTRHGLTHYSILHDLTSESLHFTRSFPIDPMHCILLNICPTIDSAWRGDLAVDKNPHYKEPQYAERKPSYKIINGVREDIGKEAESSTRHFPVSLGNGLRSSHDHYKGFKAMEWKAQLLYVGPNLYARHLDTMYLQNYLILGQIWRMLEQFSITEAEVIKLGQLCRLFIQTYQRCYWRGEDERLGCMGINVHSVLHIAGYVRDLGPGRYWWQFVMETYCGFIKPGASSKSQMNMSMANYCERMEQLYNIPFMRRHWEKKNPANKLGLLDNWMDYEPEEWLEDVLCEAFDLDLEDIDELLPLSCYKRYRVNNQLQLGSEKSQRDTDANRDDTYICFRDADSNVELQYGKVLFYVQVSGREGPGAIIKPFIHVNADPDDRTVLCEGFEPEGECRYLALEKIVWSAGILHQEWNNSEGGRDRTETDYYLVTIKDHWGRPDPPPEPFTGNGGGG